MQKLGLNVDEVDKLTGPVIGRPKSATLPYLRTWCRARHPGKVASNLYAGLPDDDEGAGNVQALVVAKWGSQQVAGGQNRRGVLQEVRT